MMHDACPSDPQLPMLRGAYRLGSRPCSTAVVVLATSATSRKEAPKQRPRPNAHPLVFTERCQAVVTHTRYLRCFLFVLDPHNRLLAVHLHVLDLPLELRFGDCHGFFAALGRNVQWCSGYASSPCETKETEGRIDRPRVASNRCRHTLQTTTKRALTAG